MNIIFRKILLGFIRSPEFHQNKLTRTLFRHSYEFLLPFFKSSFIIESVLWIRIIVSLFFQLKWKNYAKHQSTVLANNGLYFLIRKPVFSKNSKWGSRYLLKEKSKSKDAKIKLMKNQFVNVLIKKEASLWRLSTCKDGIPNAATTNAATACARSISIECCGFFGRGHFVRVSKENAVASLAVLYEKNREWL